ncbi:hypothetical protein MTsPCn5_07530 [Croceitalea sp. MTPC5]|nr:hypothetical protein MTsPCn5_07530 [Croceitalea sp. MTPC5]
MEEIYSEEQKICRITKARPETVSFLLAFSKSMKVIDCNNMKFETVLN